MAVVDTDITSTSCPSIREIGFPEKSNTPEISNDLAQSWFVTYREATTDFAQRFDANELEKSTERLTNALKALTPPRNQISSSHNNMSLPNSSKLIMNTTSPLQNANLKRAPVETFENVYNYKSFPLSPKDMPKEYLNQIEPNFQVCEGKYATSFDERHCLTVYEYKINGQWIMWDHYSGYVHLTGIWKAVGNSKADIVKLIDNSPDLEPLLRRVRGGFLKIQGTWIPYEAAMILARRTCYDIRYALIPVFGPDFPGSCLTPEDEHYGLLQLNLPPGTITSRAAPCLSQKEYGGTSDALTTTATLGIANNGRGGLMTTLNGGISNVNHDGQFVAALNHPKMSRATKLNSNPNKKTPYLNSKDKRYIKKAGSRLNIDTDTPLPKKVGRPREGVSKKTRRSSCTSKYSKKSAHHKKRASDPTGYAMPNEEIAASQYERPTRKNSLDSAESVGSLSPSEPRTPRTFPFDFRIPDGSPEISNEPKEFLQMLKATWSLMNLSSGNERKWNPGTEGPLKIDCGGQCWVWDGDDSLYLIKNHHGDDASLDQRMATISLYDYHHAAYEKHNDVYSKHETANVPHRIEPIIAYDGMRNYIYNDDAQKDTNSRYPFNGNDDYYLGTGKPSPHTYSDDVDPRYNVYGYGDGYSVPRYAPYYFDDGQPALTSPIKNRPEAEYNRVNKVASSHSKMNIDDLLS